MIPIGTYVRIKDVHGLFDGIVGIVSRTSKDDRTFYKVYSPYTIRLYGVYTLWYEQELEPLTEEEAIFYQFRLTLPK